MSSRRLGIGSDNVTKRPAPDSANLIVGEYTSLLFVNVAELLRVSFVTQCFDRIDPACATGWQQDGQESYREQQNWDRRKDDWVRGFDAEQEACNKSR